MYEALYHYFVLHKKIILPGIGVFITQRKAADIDFASKLVTAPSYTIVLQKDLHAVPSKKMFSWLAATLKIPELDAVFQFNEFIADSRNKLAAGNKLEWNGIGQISKGLGGDLVFEPCIVVTPDTAIHANKVVREKAEHNVMVGEYEKSAEEMREFLSKPEANRTYWKVITLVVAIIAAVFIGYYFYSNGFTVVSTGNQQKVLSK